MAKLQFMTIENLSLYDELIKGYVQEQDAKSLKTVAIEGNTLKFYTVEEPVGSTTPVYELTLPSTDISNLIEKISGATAGNVVIANANGTVSDGGIALSDLATNESVEAVDSKADTIIATIGTVDEGKTVVEMINDAKTSATYDDTEVRELIADNAEAIEAHKTSIDGTVTTLVGADTGKSVRTIANEELAAQLLSGNADADFKTLQELAAWLEEHPEDVAEINLNISNLQKLVGTLPEGATATDVVGHIAAVVAAEKSRAEGVESGLNTRLQAVETAIGEGYEAIPNTAIQALFD